MNRRDFLRMSAAAMAAAGLAETTGCTTASVTNSDDKDSDPVLTTMEPLRKLAAGKGLLIGAAFANHALRQDPEYGEILAREFNCLVGENNMKMDVIQHARGEFNFLQADSMLEFAARHDMKVRGVPLVWHDALPSWARDKTFPRQEALDILKEHIFTVMQHFQGRIFAWDVLNEGLNDKGPGLREKSVWFRSIGADYVEKVFQWAHEADPKALLFYNDYNMDGMSPSSDRCYEWARGMLARGIPLHGIGLQYHVQIDNYPKPESVIANIKRFNDLGLTVHITELDVWLPANATPRHLRQQAAVYRSVIEEALASPRCPAVVLWGFTDRYSWVKSTSNGRYDNGLIYDRDYNPKPAYIAIANALQKG